MSRQPSSGALRRLAIAALGLLVAGVVLLYYRSTLDAAEIRRLKDKIKSLREINGSLHGQLDDIFRERAEREAKANDPVRVGRTLPELRARGWINGTPPSLSDLGGKVVVLDLWAYW
ncbi:MAG TPA: hypothetical protein VJ783_10250 [Pirellulales bacterium]|nr:hypothetical protein [Pirellulales bacterium]